MTAYTPKTPMSLLQAVAAVTTGWMISGCSASIEDPSRLPAPPMGFNDWSRFECDINETLFTQTADAMVSTGLLAAGYNRINLDDCWMGDSRTENGTLTWNTEEFPNGLPWLGNYVKERGFFFGIYEDAGNVSCAGFPGSYGYEAIDAETFASWGVDYLKLDGCNVSPDTEADYRERYRTWHEVLDSMSTPLIFSESAPAYFCGVDNLTDWYTVMDWVPYYGELARHSYDIALYVDNDPWYSIMSNYGEEILLARYQVPGYYNDPDFLIPDHLELSLDEKKSHFALWASFSAPLIISAWIPGLPEDVISFLTNPDIIAVDKDPLAQQATLVSRDSTFDVLTRSLANGDRLLTVLNTGSDTASTSISGLRLGLPEEQGGSKISYHAKDLWTGQVTVFEDEIEISNLASHATAIYRITLSESQSDLVIPTGLIFNDASVNALTATNSSGIVFESMAGTDEQTWQIQPGVGTVSPLSNTGLCLTASNNEATLESCSNSAAQQWDYSVKGYLTNKQTGECLTEASSSLSTCQYEADGQVWALPAGVKINW